MKDSKVEFFLILLFFSFTSSSAQDGIKITKITDQNLVKTLNRVESFYIKKTSNLYIIVYVINNGSGSATPSESDESTNTILFSVSQYGEETISKLFSIGPFYNPKIDQSTLVSGSNTITVEYGSYNKRKKSTIRISLDHISYN